MTPEEIEALEKEVTKDSTEEKKPEEEHEETDDLDEDFEKFKTSKTTHTIELEEESERDKKNDFVPDEDNLTEVEDFQVQMFLGFCFALLDGFHVFVYKWVSKYELTDEDISLGEKDQAALMSYFKTRRIVEFIKKLPTELIGIFHMEYMYFRKYKAVVKKKEEEEQKQLKEEKETKSKLLIDRFRKIKKKRKEIKDKKANEGTEIKKPLAKKVKKKKFKKREVIKKDEPR